LSLSPSVDVEKPLNWIGEIPARHHSLLPSAALASAHVHDRPVEDGSPHDREGRPGSGCPSRSPINSTSWLTETECADAISTFSERAVRKGNFPLDTRNDGLLMLRPPVVHGGRSHRIALGRNSATSPHGQSPPHERSKGERDGQTAQST